jgi:2-polyprenyl-6-methoxyphenol hydroxylase-like FAD-dependent oxidoreductase
MAAVVVVGAGVAGLASALFLAERGHDVRVLDREPAPPALPPRELSGAWSRPSAPQAEHTHAFTSLGVNLLRERAPEVYDRLLLAGAEELDLGASAPPRPDERVALPYDPGLRLLACRRKVFDAVLRDVVAARPRVTVQPDTAVHGLLLADEGAPRVVGVRTAAGRGVAADLVVDATGWRSLSARWLAEDPRAARPRRPVDAATGADGAARARPAPAGRSRIAGYTRVYRRLTAELPPLNRGNSAGGLWSHLLGILHPCDNRTFTIGLGVLADDAPMKQLRHEAVFDAVVGALGPLTPWVAKGACEPISGVRAIVFPDSHLRTGDTLAGEPVQGLFPVGDAACVTSPVYGRGVALALVHAYRLAEVLDGAPRVGPEQTDRAVRAADALLGPWHAQGERDDREIIGLWRATVHGEAPPVPSPDRLSLGAAAAAAVTDPVVWRALLRLQMSLDGPDSVYRDEDILARVEKALARGERPKPLPPARAELLELMAAAH